MEALYKNIYKGKKVLITGHTGFKGSWLSLWLLDLGAKIAGYSLPPPSNPSHHDILEFDIESRTGDIRDTNSLNRFIKHFKPDIVVRLAAQSIVRKSYREPIATLETNIIGTANILEACRETDSVRAILNITSDKCYENQEWIWGYRENDRLGGHDPYSASKGCSEIITESYRKSFFPLNEYQKEHQTLVASARSGNVIGGGDWGEDRIIPDIVRATSQNEKVHIRNPHATRPWQHVLEPLSGYLLLGQRLLEEKRKFSGAWNFGPSDDAHMNVLSVVENLQKHWPQIDYAISTVNKNPHEANLLKLDCSKARTKLLWTPIWDSNIIFAKTATWYRQYYESGKVISVEQIKEYINDAKLIKTMWTN